MIEMASWHRLPACGDLSPLEALLEGEVIRSRTLWTRKSALFLQ